MSVSFWQREMKMSCWEKKDKSKDQKCSVTLFRSFLFCLSLSFLFISKTCVLMFIYNLIEYVYSFRSHFTAFFLLIVLFFLKFPVSSPFRTRLCFPRLAELCSPFPAWPSSAFRWMYYQLTDLLSFRRTWKLWSNEVGGFWQMTRAWCLAFFFSFFACFKEGKRKIFLLITV